MSYQPFDRNPSGIVFFGSSVTDQVYESNANFTFGNDVLSVPNIVIDDNGTIGSQSEPDAITLGSDGSVTILGDLTVQGTQTILNTETVTIEDNIVLLNSNVTGAPELDAGLEVERGNEANVFLIFDEGTDKWSFTNDGTTYFPIPTGIDVNIGGDSGTGSGGTLTFTGGTGITTTVAGSTVTIEVDSTVISAQTEITTAESTDELLILDGDGQLKKISKGNLVSDLGGGTVTSVGITSDTLSVSDSPITGAGDIDLEVKVDGVTIGHNASNELEVKDGAIDNDKLANSSITLTGDTGSEVVSLGDTMTVAGGTAVDTVVTATDTVTVNVKTDGTTIGVNGSGQLEVVGGLDPDVDTPGDGATITDGINLITTGASDVTVTLPTPAAGKVIRVKKIDSGAGKVNISGGSATIDGASSKTLYYQYESMTFVSDGSNWFIV